MYAALPIWSDFANDGEVKIVKEAATIENALLENAFNFIGLINLCTLSICSGFFK